MSFTQASLCCGGTCLQKLPFAKAHFIPPNTAYVIHSVDNLSASGPSRFTRARAPTVSMRQVPTSDIAFPLFVHKMTVGGRRIFLWHVYARNRLIPCHKMTERVPGTIMWPNCNISCGAFAGRSSLHRIHRASRSIKAMLRLFLPGSEFYLGVKPVETAEAVSRSLMLARMFRANSAA